MSYLTDETKKTLSKRIGIPFEDLMRMDDKSIKKLIELKKGKKNAWSTAIRVDGYPIRTMEDIDKRIDSLETQKVEDYER